MDKVTGSKGSVQASICAENGEMRQDLSFTSHRVHPTNPFVEFKKNEINQSITERFERQVINNPYHLAVITKRDRLTYTELNGKANCIARAILRYGGAGEERVGLLLDQGTSLIAALLAVLKAGKTYVPLDTSLPRLRIDSMLGDSQPCILITDVKNLSLAKTFRNSAMQLLVIDEVSSGFSHENLALTISPESGAYILYTSGSTGQPKGVFQKHRNVLHNIMKYTNSLHIASGDHLTLLSSCSFGASVSDIFGALLNGATLCPFNLADEGIINLSEWLCRADITIYHSVPTVYRQLVATLTGVEKFPRLRIIKLGGETVKRTDLELFKKYFQKGCLFHVGLGATEMNIIRQFFCDHQTVCSSATVPVGYAVDDTEVSLVDDSDRTVGFNCCGEIAIKSPYLAMGYWRKGDLTKAAFLPDPGGRDTRIYKTGDLGLMLPDGCLFHLGRKDRQVKIRGYRVEVAEIEIALSEIAQIREAVVAGHEDQYGGKFLVAYIVPHKDKSLKVSELRSLLKNKLPHYMIPSRFIFLDALPVTVSGKTDRNALPLPDLSRYHLELPYVAPRDPVEKELAKIWTEVLGIKKIGIKDNFFSLGGDSLLATCLLIEIKKIMGRDLPIRSLFECPTIKQLAEIVRDKAYVISPSPLVTIQPHGTKPPFFWVYGGTHNALLRRILGPEQPLYGVIPPALDGRDTTHKRIEEMAKDYVREIRTVEPKGPYLLGGYCFGGAVCIEMAHELRKQGQEVSMLFIVDPPRKCVPSSESSLGARSQNILSREEISRHLNNLGHLSFYNKFTYVLDRILGIGILIRKAVNRCRNRMKRIVRRLSTIVCKTYFWVGRSLPPKLRIVYIKEVQYLALRSYIPRAYPGRITVVLSGKDLSRRNRDWDLLATEGVEKFMIPGSRHKDIVFAPYVDLLAEQLSFCLGKAQAGRENTS